MRRRKTYLEKLDAGEDMDYSPTALKRLLSRVQRLTAQGRYAEASDTLLDLQVGLGLLLDETDARAYPSQAPVQSRRDFTDSVKTLQALLPIPAASLLN